MHILIIMVDNVHSVVTFSQPEPWYFSVDYGGQFEGTWGKHHIITAEGEAYVLGIDSAIKNNSEVKDPRAPTEKLSSGPGEKILLGSAVVLFVYILLNPTFLNKL